MSIENGQIEARLRLLSWMTAIGAAIILTVSVVSMGVVAALSIKVHVATQHLEQNVKANSSVLCAVRDNAEKQLANTQDYISDHANDPFPRYSDAELARSLKAEQELVDALHSGDLNC